MQKSCDAGCYCYGAYEKCAYCLDFATLPKVATQANAKCRCTGDKILLEGENCVKECTTGYYKNATTFECLKCDTSCATCSNANECDKCKEGLEKNEAGKCVEETKSSDEEEDADETKSSDKEDDTDLDDSATFLRNAIFGLILFLI